MDRPGLERVIAVMSCGLRLVQAMTLLLLPHIVLGERKCSAKWLAAAATVLGTACFCIRREWVIQGLMALVVIGYVVGVLRARAGEKCCALTLTLGAWVVLESAAPVLPRWPEQLEGAVALLLLATGLWILRRVRRFGEGSVLLSGFIASLALWMVQKPAALAWLSYLSFYLCWFLAFLLHRYQVQERKEKEFLAAQIRQMQSAEGEGTDVQALYAELRTLRHDMKHHMQVMDGLLEQGQLEAARAYRQELRKDDTLVYVNTCASGFAAVDALLLAKTAVCKRNAIGLEMKLCTLDKLPMSQPEFCAVLGNILDNAIEACCKIPVESGRRQIVFSMQIARKMLHISCKNALDEPPRKQNDRFLTDKPGEGHGYGIESIRSAVQKADGRVDFSCAEGFFFVSVLLELRQCCAIPGLVDTKK